MNRLHFRCGHQIPMCVLVVGELRGLGMDRREWHYISVYLFCWLSGKTTPKLKGCLDSLLTPIATTSSTRWNAHLTYNSKTQIVAKPQWSNRMQAPSSKHVFKSLCKGVLNPFHWSSFHCTLLCSSPFIHSFAWCLLCARCYVSNCWKGSHYKMKSDRQSKHLVQDVVSTQEAPSFCHTWLPKLTLPWSPVAQNVKVPSYSFTIPGLCTVK